MSRADVPLRVSVVVPVYNEEATVGALLDSLVAQTRAPDEIVIVDGGSADGTAEVVEAFRRRDARVVLVRRGRTHPGEGRNVGVSAAAHEVIAFTDAGIRVDPRWLEKLCEPLERDPAVDVVYGTYEPVTDSFFKECAALAYVPVPVTRGGGPIRGPFLASSLVKKAAWAAVGGFPPYRAAEDLMFMEALDASGCRVAWAPGAVVYWQMAPGWRATFRRFASYSRHNLRAGRARFWHYPAARMYTAGGVVLALAVFHTAWWLLAGVAALAARVLRTAARKRTAFGFRGVFGPGRLLGLGAVIVWLDLATAWGALTWVLNDWRRVAHGRERAVSGAS